jgi:GTP-binding protein
MGTGVLNRVLQRAIDNSPGPIGTGSHTFKLLYATQTNHREEQAVPVPHFVLFANRAFKLQDSYLRFLEARIRDEFPGEGLPFVLKVKGKTKKA